MPIYAAAPELAMPARIHTLTPEAQIARDAVADYGAARRRERLGLAGLPLRAGPHPRGAAEVVDVAALTGSPKTTAGKLAAAGARVKATRATSGAALSVWAVMPDGRRVRALYARTATGWGSGGVIIDGMLYGVTAGLARLAS